MKIKADFYKTLLDNIYDGVYFVDSTRKIIYWNKGAERITGYSAHRVIGSHCYDNLLMHSDSMGKLLCEDGCPLSESLVDGEQHTADVYLHHHDGQRVPVSVTTSPIRDSDGKIIGAVEIFRENSSGGIDPQMIQELKNAALLDSLTGLANRRFLDMKMNSNLEDIRRHNISFGVLFADIDHFKAINDTYGHSIGDAVLKMVGKTLEGNVRKSDMAGRWGGEEFVLVLSFVTEEKLRKVAEKLRMLVENNFLDTDAGRIRVTITMGGALVRKDDTIESILDKVDKLMYEGKTSGRNRVMI